jgi:predicted kinase
MNAGTPVLVVVGGLPATGKSTIAEHLARLVQAPYLRVDRIEQAIVAYSSLEHPIGPAGYAVAYALASEQLTLGLDVIVECVNPMALTRDSWVATATGVGAAIVEVEVICSDPVEHRRRVLTRGTDVDGLVKPTWDDVVGREYEPWSRSHLIIDSAETAPEQAARNIAARVVPLSEEPGRTNLSTTAAGAVPAWADTRDLRWSTQEDVHHDRTEGPTWR